VTIRTLMKFRNLDLTKDINDRYTGLFIPGVFDGGDVVPITGQLSVEIVAPWKLISYDGMVVEETSDNSYLDIPAGYTTVIAVKAVYQENDVPIINVVALELSAFNQLTDTEYYVIFAYVVVPSDAITILSSYIQYSARNIVDKLGRSPLRGVLSNASELPDATYNIAGDIYIIGDNVGDTPNIYGWNGFSWIIMTDAATVTANLAVHRANLFTNEKHATDKEKLALIGTSQYIMGTTGLNPGTPPSGTNPFVDNADKRIPTQNENNALGGSDGAPADSNRYITEEYPWAIPTEKSTIAPASISLTGNLTITSPTITGVSSVSGLVANMIVTGTGIPPNTVIVSIPTSSTITLSNPASSTIPSSPFVVTPICVQLNSIVDSGNAGFYVNLSASPSISNTPNTTNYFSFYDALLNREYMTSPNHSTNPNSIVSITGVYTDPACTTPLNPLIASPYIDQDGFVLNDLYLTWNIIPDTAYRVLYSIKNTMRVLDRGVTGINPLNIYPHPFPDAFIRRRMNDAQVPAIVIKTIADIKGRTFDTVPPTVEKNINLRRDLVNTKEYISTAFRTDNVIGDFTSVQNVPAFGNDFSNNLGIPQNYSFENTGLSPIIYNYNVSSNTGTVTYGPLVNLSSVLINQDVFIGGSLTEYKVIASNNVAKTINIQKRNGKIPRSINTNICYYGTFTNGSPTITSITSTSNLAVNMLVIGDNIPSGTLIANVDSLSQITLTNAVTITAPTNAFVVAPNTQTINYYIMGSIKKDNNPRQINLATLNYVFGRQHILCRQIQAIPNEFHPYTGAMAFEIAAPLHTMTFKEPRVRFYGGFKNRDAGNRCRVIATGYGSIMVTGFFTDLNLLLDLKTCTNAITVKIDGTLGTTISSFPSVATGNGFNNELDIQFQTLPVASNLTDYVPHTVEIDIGATVVSDFIVYGFELFRNTVIDVEVLPGRAFVQTDVYYKNLIQTGISVPRGGWGATHTRGRGTVSTRYINRNLVETTQTTSMFDMDGLDDNTCPKGSVVGSTTNFTPSVGTAKFSYYQAGDIVKLIINSTPVIEQVLVISNIVSGSAQFTTNIAASGTAALLMHVASTTGDVYDTLREFNRFTFVDLGVKQSIDFAYLLSSGASTSKFFTLSDGTTSIAAQSVAYVSTGIDGADIALNMLSSSSQLRIRAVASQLDILVANTSALTGILISIDGSPANLVNFSGGGLTRYTVWTNARYQTHEAQITNAAGLDIVGFILYEPTHSVALQGTLLATQNIVANYDSSISTDGSIVPTGSVAVDPYKFGMFINSGGSGTPWTTNFSFSGSGGSYNPYWGRYTWTNQANAYFEYIFFGDGFEIEYLAYGDRGIAAITIDGNPATLANFPTASFKGISLTTGMIDMYQNIPILPPARTKFSMSGIPTGAHTLKVLCNYTKNGSSTDFIINICTVYEVNSYGYMSYTPSKDIKMSSFVDGLNWVRDDRNFDSIPVAKDPPLSLVRVNSQSVATQDVRADKILLTTSTSLVAVTFPVPFSDSDYFLNCNIVTDAALPTVISVTPTNLLSTGFTAWFTTIPSPSSNHYYLVYTATKYL